jgi:hypothetical protein
MRFIAGLLLAVALTVAIVAAGFGAYSVYKGRNANSQLAGKPFASPSPPTVSVKTHPPTPAQPGPTALPVTGFGRIVVDGASSHVFVSSPHSSAIVVLDLSGHIVRTITDEPGADAMVVIGAVLYVTLTTAGAIDAIDTKKLSRIRTLTTGLVSPMDLVAAGGRLWTTTGPCAQWSTQLVGVDLDSGTKHTFKLPSESLLSYCAAFAANARTSNLILAWSMGLEPAEISVIDVSTGSPVFVLSAREERLGNLKDVAFTRDRTRFITASGAPYEFDEWNLSDLNQDGVIYPAGPYPVAVAVAANGKETMAGGLWDPNGQDVYEYAIGWPSTALQGRHTGTTGNQVYSRGLAFSVDGSSIYVLTGDQTPGSSIVTFNVIRASA